MLKNAIKVLSLLVVVMTFSSCGYNSMVNYDEEVASKWGNVQNSYQRRADLVPNLVETVKGAANMEKEILTEVTNARARATGVSIDPSNITPEALQKFEAAQSGLGGSLSRLLVSVERYPEIKSNRNFLDLQRQLEGTENRIKVARDEYNDAAKVYNSYVRSFPKNLYAGMFGFGRKPYFEAAQGAENAPGVNFGN